jgi:hypothetical protein
MAPLVAPTVITHMFFRDLFESDCIELYYLPLLSILLNISVVLRQFWDEILVVSMNDR